MHLDYAAGARDLVTTRSSGAGDVEAEREGDRDLRGVECAVGHRTRKPVGCGEVDRVDDTHGMGAAQFRGAVETWRSTGTT